VFLGIFYHFDCLVCFYFYLAHLVIGATKSSFPWEIVFPFCLANVTDMSATCIDCVCSSTFHCSPTTLLCSSANSPTAVLHLVAFLCSYSSIFAALFMVSGCFALWVLPMFRIPILEMCGEMYWSLLVNSCCCLHLFSFFL